MPLTREFMRARIYFPRADKHLNSRVETLTTPCIRALCPPVSIRVCCGLKSSSFAAHDRDPHTFTPVHPCAPVLCAIFTRNLLSALSVCVCACCLSQHKRDTLTYVYAPRMRECGQSRAWTTGHTCASYLARSGIREGPWRSRGVSAATPSTTVEEAGSEIRIPLWPGDRPPPPPFRPVASRRDWYIDVQFRSGADTYQWIVSRADRPRVNMDRPRTLVAVLSKSRLPTELYRSRHATRVYRQGGWEEGKDRGDWVNQDWRRSSAPSCANGESSASDIDGRITERSIDDRPRLAATFTLRRGLTLAPALVATETSIGQNSAGARIDARAAGILERESRAEGPRRKFLLEGRSPRVGIYTRETAARLRACVS